MGVETSLDDAYLAFQPLATKWSMNAKQSDFREALRVLDDSFLSSRENRGRIFINVTNPSVQDFVASWLNDNPDQAVDVINSAIYFEQIRWLSRKLDSSQVNDQAVRAGIQRCFDSKSAYWYQLTFERAEPRMVRNPLYIEDRLRIAIPYLSNNESDNFNHWFASQLWKARREMVGLRSRSRERGLLSGKI